ncbi:FAD binding domain-containing protein [Rhodobacteraceae bacterium D3-12]|nr:FAD binding domain-containing protein [Rhodobacteraceae bacterium D3-12]
MIPASFSYKRPETIDEAVALLTDPNSVPLAGGHSLLTRLKRRTQRPSVVVDISRLGLEKMSQASGRLNVGAMVRQANLKDCEGGCALLNAVVDATGDSSTRANGTLVGALCAKEPGGDWIPAALALDGVLSIVGPEGRETIPLSQALTRPIEGRLVTEVALSIPGKEAIQGYRKVKHAAVGWSIASVAFLIEKERVRFSVGGAVARPGRLKQIENAVLRGTKVTAEQIAAQIDALEPIGDRYASAKYRARRLTILVNDIISEVSQTDR